MAIGSAGVSAGCDGHGSTVSQRITGRTRPDAWLQGCPVVVRVDRGLAESAGHDLQVVGL